MKDFKSFEKISEEVYSSLTGNDLGRKKIWKVTDLQSFTPSKIVADFFYWEEPKDLKDLIDIFQGSFKFYNL